MGPQSGATHKFRFTQHQLTETKFHCFLQEKLRGVIFPLPSRALQAQEYEFANADVAEVICCTVGKDKPATHSPS